MTETTETMAFTEAAPAVSAPCRPGLVNGGRPLGSARTLAERCAR
jgi:hypothetical protein